MPTLCDPCPGKMKAVVKGVPSRGWQVALDTLDETGWTRSDTPSPRRSARLWRRASVADNGDARETEQRRAAVFE